MSKPDYISQEVWNEADRVRFAIPADWDGTREDHVAPIARAIQAAEKRGAERERERIAIGIEAAIRGGA